MFQMINKYKCTGFGPEFIIGESESQTQTSSLLGQDVNDGREEVIGGDDEIGRVRLGQDGGHAPVQESQFRARRRRVFNPNEVPPGSRQNGVEGGADAQGSGFDSRQRGMANAP